MSDAPARPAVVSIEMGYGHLRAALPLADALQTTLLHVDRPPLASERDVELWQRARHFYEVVSRGSQLGALGAPLRALLDDLTNIAPLHPPRDLSKPQAGVRVLEWAADRGLGRGLVEYLRDEDAALLTTFYSPAIIADRLGMEQVYCVITDTDLNRVWVPSDPASSRIQYLAPSRRAVRRLRAYGVADERIHLTGFPLPPQLLGGPDLPILRDNLASRLMRLDTTGAFRASQSPEIFGSLGELPAAEEGRAPTLMYAIGGAGAQVGIAADFLPSLRPSLREGRLRLVLVAGVRHEVAERFGEMVDDAGLGAELGGSVEILVEPDFEAYYRRFNARLATTDILWTKPSEITFYAALGIPLILSPPVGVHEGYNRRWAMQAGAAFPMREAEFATHWLDEMLEDGTLAGGAWAGFTRLPADGTYRIAELFQAEA